MLQSKRAAIQTCCNPNVLQSKRAADFGSSSLRRSVGDKDEKGQRRRESGNEREDWAWQSKFVCVAELRFAFGGRGCLWNVCFKRYRFALAYLSVFLSFPIPSKSSFLPPHPPPPGPPFVILSPQHVPEVDSSASGFWGDINNGVSPLRQKP